MSGTRTGHTESTRGDLGHGIYSLAELRAYLSYFGGKADGARALDWLTTVLNPVAHQPRRADYSFSDLISLFVVRELRRLGVQPARIREAELYMRDRFDTDRPFVTEEVATDGRTVFVRSDVPEQIETAQRPGGQQADRQILGPYLHSVRYDDGIAAEWSPEPHIVLNPRIQFGDPVIAGTRLLTSIVAEAAKRDEVDRVAVRYDIRPAAARSAIEFESRLSALRG